MTEPVNGRGIAEHIHMPNPLGGCEKCPVLKALQNLLRVTPAGPEAEEAFRIIKAKGKAIDDDKCKLTAANDDEAVKLYFSGYEPLCPQCKRRAFPTNFPPKSLGGKEGDNRIVWFCSDMGHCTFPVTSDTKWQKMSEKTMKRRNIKGREIKNG